MKENNGMNRAVVVGLIAVIIGLAILVQPVAAVTPNEQGRGFIQEAMGLAIVDAARAQTVAERANAQEVLGRLIVTAVLLGLPETSTAETVMTGGVLPTWSETQGEVVFWPLASLGAFMFLAMMWCEQCRAEAKMVVGGAVRQILPEDGKGRQPLPIAA